VKYLQFNTVSPGADNPGRLRWNDTDGTLNLQGKNGAVTLQLGQESVQIVKNNTAGTLLDGHAVRVTGSSSGRMTVDFGDNSTITGATGVIGVLTQSISAGAEGYVTTYGLVRNLNTSAWTQGSPLYLGLAGNLTTTPPTNNQIIQLGYVVVSDAVSGAIYVNPLQNFLPVIGGPCTVSGKAGIGVYALVDTGGKKWVTACDLP
jgi:hypothetical protein